MVNNDVISFDPQLDKSPRLFISCSCHLDVYLIAKFLPMGGANDLLPLVSWLPRQEHSNIQKQNAIRAIRDSKTWLCKHTRVQGLPLTSECQLTLNLYRSEY